MWARTLRHSARAAPCVLAATAAAAAASPRARSEDDDGVDRVFNWSGTHSCAPREVQEPQSLDEIVAAVQRAHATKTRLRPIGNALSPNGLGFSDDALINVGQCDKILSVDCLSGQVRVQAGARIEQITEALREHGLVLEVRVCPRGRPPTIARHKHSTQHSPTPPALVLPQNYASIASQQVGGFCQVGAHGTGARIPPCDEQVVGMTLVTPACGALKLSAKPDEHPELFKLARVGLGCLGVVAEVTLQCVKRHELVERTYVTDRSGAVGAAADAVLAANKHVRFMWIPHTDKVVVVTSNPVAKVGRPTEAEIEAAKHPLAAAATAPLRRLLADHPAADPARAAFAATAGLSFAQLRDELLKLAPLDPAHVARVNAAEAEFWQRASGTRIAFSDQVLGFECGGNQWVSEVAMAADAAPGAGTAYVTSLLEMIEKENIAAPAPIEQRWTSGSSSPMSPAFGGALHSWVGIIMCVERAERRRALRRLLLLRVAAAAAAAVATAATPTILPLLTHLAPLSPKVPAPGRRPRAGGDHRRLPAV